MDPQDLADEKTCAHVADVLFQRAFAHMKRREAEGDVDHMGENMIAKLVESALKALRLKRDIREKYQAIEHDEKLMEHDRLITGIRGKRRKA